MKRELASSTIRQLSCRHDSLWNKFRDRTYRDIVILIIAVVSTVREETSLRRTKRAYFQINQTCASG